MRREMRLIKAYLEYEVFIKRWIRSLLLELGLQVASLVRQKIQSDKTQSHDEITGKEAQLSQ